MSRQLLPFSIALLVALMASPAGAQDLSGVWRDDRGARYLVRQVDEQFCWSVAPTNVFCGIVVGKLIAGRWLDLPTGRFYGHGRMVLQVVSPDRLVKVSQTASYGGEIWTREGSAPVSAATPPQAPPPSAPPPSPTPPPPGPPTAGGQPYTPPSGGARAAEADENGGTKNWVYRSVGEEYQNKIGKRIRFVCPPDPEPTVEWRGTYGTGIYTGDSALCAAAVHDGRITRAGGPVTVEIMPGQSSYRGSTQNGIKSGDWGSWGISFSFSVVTVDYDRGEPSRAPAAQPTVTPPPDVTARGTLNWADPVAPELRTRPGARIRYTCPPGGQFYGYVWGTDTYTGDSLPCAAAVHAGAITFAAGGTITVEIRPGQGSYHGSERNGVASKSFPAYSTSFVIVK